MHPRRRSAARARGPKSSRRWKAKTAFPIPARRQDNSVNLLAESRSKFGSEPFAKVNERQGAGPCWWCATHLEE